MRLSQREQILLQKAAHENPGSLADWLLGWVEAQQKVGVNGSFDISEIVIPIDLDKYPPTYPTIPPTPTPPLPRLSSLQEIHEKAKLVEKKREEARAERQAKKKERGKILAEINYPELPITQRKAIRKFLSAEIDEVSETERLPDNEECWLGDHKMKGWEDEDFYLWIVSGTYESGNPFRKWGCVDCAKAIIRTHPELQVGK